MILEKLKLYDGNCITDSNGIFTFSDLFIEIKKIQSQLNERINKNERVVIYSDYSFYSVALLIYLSQLPINIIPIVKTTNNEYKEKLDAVNPNKILTIGKEGKIFIEEVNYEINKDSLLLFNNISSKGNAGIVLFSSGTSGKPKVMIQNLTEIIRSIKKPRKQKSLVFIILLMFDHIGGLNTLLNCLISGSPFVIPSDRKPSTIINLIKKNNINVLPTTPTFLNLMLMDEAFSSIKLKSLKLITYGTERMSDTLLRKINKLLPRVKFLQTFGTSETGILKTQSKSSSSLYFKIVDDENEHKIVDGELYLKSVTSVNGYLNHNNDNFKNDGWYATGDLVEQDEEGFIKIIGRKNKIINVGGLKVLPKEVEDVINNIDGVIDSTIFGEENNLTGNIVCAKIYTKDIDTSKLKIIIKKTCRKKLDKYKIPVKIYFDKLKITERGKKS